MGMKERGDVWVELYFSQELQRGARHLLPNGDLWQDLLSDAIIDVMTNRTDVDYLRSIGKLPAMVFMYMRSMAVRHRSKWRVAMGSMESDSFAGVDLEFSGNGGDEIFTGPLNGWAEDRGAAIEDREAEPVTNDEIQYANRIFGGTTAGNVRLMRAIDEADKNKEGNEKRWEQAQFAKLYLELGSYRKVQDATGVGYQQVRSRVKEFAATLTDSQMKISVVTYGAQPTTGMELYRLYYPYFNGLGQTHTTDFSVRHITYEYLESQPAAALEDDVYVFSRLQHVEVAEKVLAADKKLVVDVDDYWNLHKEHPRAGTDENNRYVSNLTAVLQKAHLVTCTTDELAKHCSWDLNVNAVVIKNTIPASDKQFHGDALPHSKVRFGWIGGVFHHNDIFQLYDGLKKLYTTPELNDKYQICLGGFNPNGEYQRYEKIFTCDNYAVRNDTDYLDYLGQYSPGLDHIGYNKPYRRMWAKPVTQYGQMYREIDVALIPLAGGLPFNECKSELKLIEAGMTGKAAIVSDVLPYSPHLQHEVNCLVASPMRRDWYTQMRRMILDADLREETAAALSKYVRKEFNHGKEVNKLATALRRLK
jgi:hypothetical protein